MPLSAGKFVTVGGPNEMVDLLCERRLVEVLPDKHAKQEEEILYRQKRKLGPTSASPD